MAIRKLRQDGDISDAEFDKVYPPAIRLLSQRHWTSVSVARIVSGFLCHKKGGKILDIGSGVGKFCLIGATLHPGCSFHGIEFRNHFTALAEQIKKDHDIKNTSFIIGDVMDMDFLQYDGIYFFNSFHEQIDTTSSLGEDRNSFRLSDSTLLFVVYLLSPLTDFISSFFQHTLSTSDFSAFT